MIVLKFVQIWALSIVQYSKKLENTTFLNLVIPRPIIHYYLSKGIFLLDREIRYGSLQQSDQCGAE
jgi:hypothetical protein